MDLLGLTQQDAPIGASDLTGQNVYGDVLIRRDPMCRVMERLGFEFRNATWRVRSSAVHWLGALVTPEGNTLRVEVKAAIVVRVGYNHKGWEYIKSPSPSTDNNFTHFKLNGYMAENIHIVGTGRNKYAWDIYRGITALLEKERKEYEKLTGQR